MNFVPIHGRLVIERKAAETKSVGGIIIPDTATDKPSEGLVIAESEGNEPKLVGKNVLFGKYSGTEFKLGEKTYLLVPINEIFGYTKEEVQAATP